MDFDRRPLIVAAATPLTEGGHRLDEAAIWPMIRFGEEHGGDGAFVCGTTGEGILLSSDERKRAAVVFRAAVRGMLIVHGGAQSTADTVELAAHAAEIGADAVAVIPPPYFPLDADALTEHLVSAAAACAPLPFFIYAFAARSGYPLPIQGGGREGAGGGFPGRGARRARSAGRRGGIPPGRTARRDGGAAIHRIGQACAGPTWSSGPAPHARTDAAAHH